MESGERAGARVVVASKLMAVVVGEREKEANNCARPSYERVPARTTTRPLGSDEVDNSYRRQKAEDNAGGPGGSAGGSAPSITESSDPKSSRERRKFSGQDLYASRDIRSNSSEIPVSYISCDVMDL
jgi:hypothetical protein